jgi:hypothetical protein
VLHAHRGGTSPRQIAPRTSPPPHQAYTPCRRRGRRPSPGGDENTLFRRRTPNPRSVLLGDREGVLREPLPATVAREYYIRYRVTAPCGKLLAGAIGVSWIRFSSSSGHLVALTRGEVSPIPFPFSLLRLAYLRMVFGVSGIGGRTPAMAWPWVG